MELATLFIQLSAMRDTIDAELKDNPGAKNDLTMFRYYVDNAATKAASLIATAALRGQPVSLDEATLKLVTAHINR